VKVGRLYLKLDEVDLEILKFKKIEDLIGKGFSFEEAQKVVEETLRRRREQIKEEYKKLDEEEKDIESRKDISEEDKAELKKLWRKLAHKYHPDKANGNEEMMKKINKAYAEGDLETLRAIDQNEVGTDIEVKTIEALKNKLAGLKISGQISYLVADGQNLPLPDNSVDCLFLAASLHHFENQADLLSEILRILKKNGRRSFHWKIGL